MADVIVNLVLDKLADVVVQEALFLYGVRDKVERVQRQLLLMQFFLRDTDRKLHKDERLKQLVNEVQQVGYLIDDVLDKFLAEVGAGKLGGLHNILKRIGMLPMKQIAKNTVGNEIEHIEQRLLEITDNTRRFVYLGITSTGPSIKPPVINPDIEMVETIVNRVVGKLADAVVQEALFVYGVRNKVERVQRDLTWFNLFLKDAATMFHKYERVKIWVNMVREVSYMIEGVLDKLLAEVGGGRPKGLQNILKRIGKMPMELISKHKVGNKIDNIQQRISEIMECITNDIYDLKKSSSGASVEQPIRPFVNTDIDEMEVFGFEVDRKAIVNQLIDTNITRQSVISIVGAGGSGKTTLAKEVFKSAELKCHFDISMWLTIGQDCKLIDILKKMLNYIGLEWQKEDERYLITELNKCMTERKYLVVLDDVWHNDVWYEVVRTLLHYALPNVNNGSRVLITTRFINIAKGIDIIIKPHMIRPLNEEESKELLLKKIFPNQFANECPNDLLPLATKFTKICRGWPLPLVVLGGILSKQNPNHITWDEVMQKMDWQTDGSRFMGVISTSYEDLPIALKPCFIYLGVFPEDCQIKATTLIQLWIAEGFVRQEGARVLEDIAERYLEELVARCMVQVSRRSFIGKIKYCHIHTLLRELAIHKAKENNFLTVVLKNDTKLSSSTCARRIALHVHDDEMIEHANRNLRSLISFAYVPNLNKFGALRVLHIGTEPYEFSTGENCWTLLKYFGFECSLYSYCQLPTSKCLKRSHLTCMNNVQTVRIWFCKTHDELPPSFWGNKKLRHVNITCCFFCEAAPEGPPSAADLQSLLTLKGVRARQDWVAKLPNFSYIRKLGIVIPEDVAGELLINLLSTLNYLSSLHLEMSGSRRMAFPSCISAFRNHMGLRSFSLVESIWPRKEVVDCTLFPPFLMKLTLDRFSFEEDPMPQLEKLPNLSVLKLSGKIEATDGNHMICSSGDFAHLQGLLLDVRNLEEWKIEEGAMPMLNQLVLKRCRKLQIVPDLQYLRNLQEFTMHHCLNQFNSRLQGEENWKIKHIPSVSVFPWLSS